MNKMLSRLQKEQTFTAMASAFSAPALLVITSTALAGDILFVSDSTTDSENIPLVLSGGSPEVAHLSIPDAGYRPAATVNDHNVTIIRNDFTVTGGAFGVAEGTNMALAGAVPGVELAEYCSVFWSASGPHEPDPFAGGIGADGGIHNDPAVFASLEAYVATGGFVLVTGHDSVTDPMNSDMETFVGGAGTVAAQQIRMMPNDPLPGKVIAGPNALTDGVIPLAGNRPGMGFPGGVNILDGVQDLDYLAGWDATQTSAVVPEPEVPGAAMWTIRTPSGVANQSNYINTGHIGYVANGIFLFEDLPFNPGTFLSNGEDGAWTADYVYNAALRNFAFNSCISLPFDAGETPVANNQFLETSLTEPIDFTLTGSDPNGDPLSFTILSYPAFGAINDTAIPDLTYTPNGVFTGDALLTFVVSDGTRTSDPGTITITVLPNPPPVADADGPYNVNEGDSISLDGTGSSDPLGDALTYEWDLDNDGVFETSGATPTFSAASLDGPELRTVTLRVSDGVNTDTDSSTVTVDNVAPSVDAGAGDTINEGDTFSSPGSFTDPGTLDTWSATVDYGEGAGPQALALNPDKSFSLSNVYDDDGVYQVTVKVQDDDGGVGSAMVTVTVNNLAPTVNANLPTVTVNEGDPAGNTGTFADLGNDVVTVTASVGLLNQVGAQSGTWSWLYVTSDGPDNSQTVTITATDDQGAFSTTTFDLVVLNVPPVANDDAYGTNEDTPLIVPADGVLANDSDVGLDMLIASVATGPSNGTLALNGDGSFTYTPDANWFGVDSFVYRATDDDGAFDTAMVTINVAPVNDPPSLSVNIASQTVQYSDGISQVTITASDVDTQLPPLSLSNSGLPAGLSVSAGVCAPDFTVPAGVGGSCTWTMSGNIGEGAGTYPVTFTVNDGAGLNDTTGTSITVVQENASIALHEDNMVAIMVDGDGSDSSLPFSLTTVVTETFPDLAANGLTAAGDIGNAVVSMALTPVGPGGAESPDSCDLPVLTGAGYAGELSLTCHFSGVPVNTYSVDVTVSGDYYTGAGDDVFTVYDPSLGFTTGGGWFYWPGTDDKTNFGYTMKYGKNGRNVKGSLLIIRHLDDGTKYRFKSNALEGLAVGQNIGPDFGWASFSGKGTYLEPGWPDPIGNHTFTMYVEDYGEPGAGNDRLWFESRDRNGLVLPDFSMPAPATTNAETIDGGNLVVPHATSKK
jgi:hypothetical protein